MIVKFKAGHYGRQKIEPIEVERETEVSVWINGRRSAKRSGYENYFDTWEEAHSYLIEYAQNVVDRARFQLNRANGELGNIKGMKNPDEKVSA